MFGVTQTSGSDEDFISATIPYLVIKKPDQHTISFSSTCTEMLNVPAGNTCSGSSHFPQASPSNLCLPRLLSFINRAVRWVGGWVVGGVGSSPSSRTSRVPLCKNLLAYAPPLIPDGNHSSLRRSTSPTPLRHLFNPSFMLVHLPPVCTQAHTSTAYPLPNI